MYTRLSVVDWTTYTGTKWYDVVAVFPQIQNKDSLEIIIIIN